jgi:acetyl esterase/lipase
VTNRKYEANSRRRSNATFPHPETARLALASSLLADDLANLPPATIFTAEYDPLREDGERYAARLRSANVPAHLISHPGALHGTAMLTPNLGTRGDVAA